jgi:DNA-binding MarR family transcriptional regulator
MSCTGFNLRKAMRVVSQLYDDHLRPTGIRGTQFALMVVIKLTGPVLVSKLAEYAVMDRTTLTRNLDILEKQGLIELNQGSDKRTRLVSITQKGMLMLDQAYPLWEQAQNKVNGALGQTRLQSLMADLSILIKTSQS